MTNISFKTLDKISGPLIFVKGVDDAAYGEMVEIKLPNGERRQGQVLDTSRGLAVVQVFGQTLGLTTTGTTTDTAVLHTPTTSQPPSWIRLRSRAPPTLPGTWIF